MALPPNLFHRTAPTGNVARTGHADGAAPAEGPRQRSGIMGRMATLSQSAVTKGRNLRDGLFRARPGDAASVPRSSPAPTPDPGLADPGLAPPPVALPLMPKLTMALDNQKLVFGADGHTTHTEKLLDGILNTPADRYKSLAHLGTHGDQSTYALIDARDRLIHAQASNLSVSVFKSSGTHVNPASLTMPDHAHRAQVTGVHVGDDGQAWRLHEKKLYALENGEWKERTHVRHLKSLHSVGDGTVYALGEDGKVRSLKDPRTPLEFTHKVSALGSATGGGLIALSEDDDHTPTLERLHVFGDGVHDIQPLRLPTGTPNDEALKPKSVTIAGNTLLATSASGKLLQAHISDNDLMPSLDPDAPEGSMVPRPPLIGLDLHLSEKTPDARLQNAFGEHTVSDFFHDDQGQLHARVKDQKGAEHSAQWDPHRQDFKPGWNMAPLIMDRQKGLPTLTPDAQSQIRLPRGNIALSGNDLLVQDPRTEQWKKGSEKDLKALQAGQDGCAYLVDKDGKLKQLKVAPQAAAHEMGKGADLALPGRGTEAKGTVMRGAEHLTVDKVAVQNDQKYVTLSSGQLRLHDQNGERAFLPSPPGTGPIQSLSSGGKDWYALRNDQLFRLPGDSTDPKKMSTETPRWDPVTVDGPLAGATLQDLRPDHDGKLLAKTDRGDFVRNGDGTWAAATAPADPARKAHERFDQLVAGEPDFTRRGNVKASLNVLGRSNIETIKSEQFAPARWNQNYLTSHLSPTGAVKVPADSVQHAWKGREGLKPIYTGETDALQTLAEKSTAAMSAVNAPTAASRIDALKAIPIPAQTPALTELTELFDWFHKTVADDLQHTLRELAEKENALLKNGEVNPAYQGKPRANDMLTEVAQVARNSGINDTHPLGKLLNSLQDQHFTLEHRTSQTGLDASRKRGDDQALLRARLALDINVLDDISKKLSELVAETQKTGPQNLDAIARSLAKLHNDAYEGSPIKRYTDAGFRNHAALEASYDATKSLLKYMRKDNHPVKRSVLQGLETRPDALVSNLTNALRDLEPRESLKLNRNYGGGVTGGVSGPEGKAFLGFRGSIDPERTFGLTFTRFDRGLKVALNREGAVSGTASFGFGNGISDTRTTPGDSHQNIQSNGGWFGGSLDGKYKYTDNTALSFFIRDDELEAFMKDLMEEPLHTSKQPDAGGLKPMALMDRGVEKEVRETTKHNFDLDVGLNIESRTNKGQTDAEPVAGFMRFGAGLLASLSLLSAERERTEGHGSDGLSTDIYSSNRARFLEKGSVSGYARMFSTVFSSRPSNLFIAGGAPMGVTASLSFDNKTGKTYDVRFKHALPVQNNDLKSLAETLEKAYPALPKNQPTEGHPADRTLLLLKTKYLSAGAPKNDAQFAALASLRQLDRQNTAAKQGSSLMSLMDMVVKHNNVNRVDQAALSKRGIDWTKELLGLDVNPGNAEHIHDLMSNDPQLKGLLDELKRTKGTTRAELKLEVRDDIKQRIEEGALAGTLTDKDLKEMLANKDNLRIKSIAIFRTAAKDDSLAIPLPYVSFKSGSNLSIERLRGEVTFDYGLDQTQPKKFTLDGEQADQSDPQPARDLASDAQGVFRPA
ncbi:AvrE-family type 3 secretion system effector [Pseudomonas sp. NPDC088368]|uniref:AvrE-family type 3 secretion system effector n=1 Tax=Pseudomonas sp. NPDC088368 TaxID=3364453 RepID=UPI0038029771